MSLGRAGVGVGVVVGNEVERLKPKGRPERRSRREKDSTPTLYL